MLIDNIISILKKETARFAPTLIDQIIAQYGKNPFLILIACLLSLRTKDIVSIHVCRDLFNKAKTPQELLCISIPELEKIIKRIGFYKTKAKVLHSVSKEIIERFHGNVPNTMHELMSIKGVGSKTANLVLGMAFDMPAICVDTHVHRISNRLGIIKTKTPQETQEALEKLLPKKYWTLWNKLLVIWGQNICVPISPFVSKCALEPLCKKIGVKKAR